MVGKLRFLADRTRPDLAYATSFLARFTINPTPDQRNLTYRTLQFANDTTDNVLKLGSLLSTIKLFAYCDAAFAKDTNSNSQLSYCLFLARDSGSILWKSWKDKTVSLSTTQSELHALVECTKTILWYRELLNEIGLQQTEPTVIYQDNHNVLELVSKDITNDAKSKYLINKINFIRDLVQRHIILPTYCPTTQNTADIGTKPLDRQYYNLHSKGIRFGPDTTPPAYTTTDATNPDTTPP